MGVSAVGPSGRKADYSSYGREHVDVAAPGGWFRDGFGTPTYRSAGNQILSTLPKAVLQKQGAVDEKGQVTTNGAADGVQRACRSNGRCGYYGYLQGSSMAAPHAAGVAALVVSKYGRSDARRPGTLTMPSWQVRKALIDSTSPRACPSPRRHGYSKEEREADYDAYCAGSPSFNGFFGHGMVDAYAAVTARR